MFALLFMTWCDCCDLVVALIFSFVVFYGCFILVVVLVGCFAIMVWRCLFGFFVYWCVLWFTWLLFCVLLLVVGLIGKCVDACCWFVVIFDVIILVYASGWHSLLADRIWSYFVEILVCVVFWLFYICWFWLVFVGFVCVLFVFNFWIQIICLRLVFAFSCMN